MSGTGRGLRGKLRKVQVVLGDILAIASTENIEPREARDQMATLAYQCLCDIEGRDIVEENGT